VAVSDFYLARNFLFLSVHRFTLDGVLKYRHPPPQEHCLKKKMLSGDPFLPDKFGRKKGPFIERKKKVFK